MCANIIKLLIHSKKLFKSKNTIVSEVIINHEYIDTWRNITAMSSARFVS